MNHIQKEERHTLSQKISEQLKQYIIEEQLVPGQTLPSERELAKLMQVSRPVIREALRALELSGVLSIRHGEGAFIQSHSVAPLFDQLLFLWKLDNKKVCDLFDLRQIFELAAIEQIVQRATVADFDHLEALALEMRQAGGDTELMQAADIRFHQALVSAAHHELFAQLTEVIVQYFARTSHHHMGQSEVDKTVAEHLHIVDALRKRDEAEAKRILRAHLEFSKKYVRDINDSI